MPDDHDRDYEVGYGRPPVAKRFSSEHQPRRRGGKRPPKGLASELRRLLGRKQPLKINGVPTQELPLRIILQAMKRDAQTSTNPRVRLDFLNFVRSVLGTEDFQEPNHALVAADRDLLAEWAKDFQAEEAAGAGEELAELGSAVAADGTDDADQPHGEE